MNRENYFSPYSLEELPQTAADLIASLQHPLILFIGDLGAGKTTLIKELIAKLGSADSGSSPSYSLINEYKIPDGKLYHLDLYRLTSVHEAFALGLEDILYSGAYCMVEWPQLVMDYLDPPYHVVELSLLSDGRRELKLSQVSQEPL